MGADAPRDGSLEFGNSELPALGFRFRDLALKVYGLGLWFPEVRAPECFRGERYCVWGFCAQDVFGRRRFRVSYFCFASQSMVPLHPTPRT